MNETCQDVNNNFRDTVSSDVQESYVVSGVTEFGVKNVPSIIWIAGENSFDSFKNFGSETLKLFAPTDIDRLDILVTNMIYPWPSLPLMTMSGSLCTLCPRDNIDNDKNNQRWLANKSTQEGRGVEKCNPSGSPVKQEDEKAEIESAKQEATKKTLFATIIDHDYDHEHSIKPLGLSNKSNMCFFNAVLQALIHCRPFLALILEILTNTDANNEFEKAPVLAGFINFAWKYSMGRPTGALHLYDVVCAHSNFKHLVKGEQEDAQEFLGYLLDTLERNFEDAPKTNVERVMAAKRQKDREQAEQRELSASQWTEIGGNCKAIIPRKTGSMNLNNPILNIFGGRVRSTLRKPQEPPSVTIEPFQQLHVDISYSEINTLQEAIDKMMQVETLQIEQNRKTVTATKQLQFERVPRILIVCLKRFAFVSKGNSYEYQKISKPIAMSDLNILCGEYNVSYRPFAIIQHHGSSANIGHYTTDVLVNGKWWNLDDNLVIEKQDIDTGGSAYVAFYQQVK